MPELAAYRTLMPFMTAASTKHPRESLPPRTMLATPSADAALYPRDLLVGANDFDPIGANDLDAPARRWWLLHTKSRQEKAVSLELRSRRLAYYLPLVPRRSLSRGRPREAQVPLFPSYVFLYGTVEERMAALRTNRLAAAHAVENGGVLRQQLAQIAGLISLGAPLTPEARLEPGQRVRVKSGPCAGYEGTLIKRHGKTRLVVRVEQLLQGASVEIEDFRLEAI